MTRMRTLHKRRERRAQKRKGGTRSHRRRGGRTGSIRSKQLAGGQ